jgi:glucose-6-phosphate-specific signal transduction histidine kinase
MIEDNGQGFDVVQPVKGHFGLIGINERVKCWVVTLTCTALTVKDCLNIHIPRQVT